MRQRLEHQYTLATNIEFSGRGLHTGTDTTVRIRPADPGTGVVFLRTDVPMGRRVILARWFGVVSTNRSMTLGNVSGVTLMTVEHLLAALIACGVDNAKIEVDGPEIPILDGSSRPFVTLISQAGLVVQTLPRRIIRVKRAIGVRHGDSVAVLNPSPAASVSARIEYSTSAIGRQEFTYEVGAASFREHIASARTFVLLKDVPQLRQCGLALGGTIESAIVVGEEGVLNREGLRYKDEFVRHKILDIVGDLSLAGAPIVANAFFEKPGHLLNYMLLKRLFSSRQSWEYDCLPTPNFRSSRDYALIAG